MTAAVPSKSTLTYGALTLGGSSDYRPHGKYSMTVDYGSRVLTLDYPFVVTDLSDAKLAELESKLEIENANLELTFDGKVRSWKVSDGTGFNHRGELIKPGDDRDTRTTRYHIARFTVDLPASAADGGLGDASWTLTANRGGRQTLTMRGVYTGIAGTTSAYANYLDKVEDFVDTIRTLVGGTLEEKTSQREVAGNKEDSRLEWSRTYEGIIYPQSLRGLDDPVLVDPLLSISVTELGGDGTPAGSEPTAPPIRATVTYSSGVDSSVAATYPRDVWVSIVRPNLIAVIRDHLEVTAIALIEDSPESDLRDSELRGRLVVDGYTEGANNITSYRMTASHGGQPSQRKMPLSSAGQFDAHVYGGPADLELTITETIEVLGTAADLFSSTSTVDPSSGIQLGNHGTRVTASTLEDATGSRWIPTMLPAVDQTPLTVGIAPHTVDLVQITRRQTWTRVDTPAVTSES